MQTLSNSDKILIKNAAIGIIKEFKEPINFFQFMTDAIMALSNRDVKFEELDDNDSTSSAITFMRLIMQNWIGTDGDEVERMTKAIHEIAEYDSAENWRNVLTYIQCAVLV